MELTIEKLIYGGEGLARLPADERGRGKTVFVPDVLEGERVEASIVEEKPGFARARVERLLQASVLRIEPGCRYFSRCGGCQYQYTSYEHQLEIKSAILRETLRRQGKIEFESAVLTHPSPPWNYRNRSRFQVRHAPQFAIGYFEAGSHHVLAVEECPISSALINRALAALWELGRAGKVAEGLQEIELFADADDQRLLVELLVDGRRDAEDRAENGQALIRELQGRVPEVVSGAVFPTAPQTARGGQAVVAKPDWVFGDGALSYAVAGTGLRVSAGSFFQINRFLIDELVKLVCDGRSGEQALDLYAGVGLFSLALAKSFRHVRVVESSQSSAADLKYNCPPNTKVVRTSVEEFLDGKGSRTAPELVVVDPPRAGLGERVARALGKVGAPRMTYVSCDPATLARDLVPLRTAGYRIEQVHMVDLFPQTYHLESVVQLAR